MCFVWLHIESISVACIYVVWLNVSKPSRTGTNYYLKLLCALGNLLKIRRAETIKFSNLHRNYRRLSRGPFRLFEFNENLQPHTCQLSVIVASQSYYCSYYCPFFPLPYHHRSPPMPTIPFTNAISLSLLFHAEIINTYLPHYMT